MNLLCDSESCSDLESKLIIVAFVIVLCLMLILIFVYIEDIPIDSPVHLGIDFLKAVYQKKVDKKIVREVLTHKMQDLNAIPILEMEKKMLMQCGEQANSENINLGQDICVFCMQLLIMEDNKENEQCKHVLILQCKHVFHVSCAVEWFEINLTCPVCRSEVRKQLINKIYNYKVL